ncbi:MAG: cytochrome b/b6 domain-containing protein [Paracoccaceae bacterium]|nr:cytochrome b/b6 domain-containing protein [Paracoccaceae bacterium]MDE3123497.1 cytochrome b/b6 domain-containing protein [Paracoccaceae bacterium]MDE3239570.1 cytochrome b/b6 domain-containing protein [Paracoccaceae bacterium]
MTIRVWDPALRLFHWALVGAFALAWLTSEEGRSLHETAGYVVAGLIGFRLVWGLVGPRYARFAQFVPGPGRLLSYAGDMLKGRERRYVGHNPAGAAMIVALLLSLSGTALTGWLSAEPARMAYLPSAPALVSVARADEAGGYGEGGEGSEGGLKDLHGALANLTLLLVGLHVAGVALSSLRHRENLARAMVTGRKRAPEGDDIA